MAMKNVVEPQQCTTIWTLFAPGKFQDFADGGGIVLGGHIVAARLKGGGGQFDAVAVIEQPHVIAVGVEVFEKIGFNGVDGKDQAGNAQAVRKDHRPLGASLVANQAQANSVRSLEKSDLRRTHPQWALFARRGIRVKYGGTDEHVGIGIEQRPHKEPSEFGLPFEALGKAAGVDDFHGGHLASEVLGSDVENAFAQDRAGCALAIVDRDVEGRCGGP